MPSATGAPSKASASLQPVQLVSKERRIDDVKTQKKTDKWADEGANRIYTRVDTYTTTYWHWVYRYSDGSHRTSKTYQDTSHSSKTTHVPIFDLENPDPVEPAPSVPPPSPTG